eukprot:TRINITY_DN19393_c0_g1_i1.p1 TRINITY_DN19393_c0_g1~~TRINITY_DN19393_c0_g1_i1.p1  ORF type:complete len:1085 (-),score=193.71 TRINITY_DN19393_c0_g1_i1:111-3365(-)
MGKRAAAKPKAEPAAKKPKAKARTKGSSGLRPPPAPGCWARPEPQIARLEEEALRFFLVDIEDGPASSDGLEQELRLYGTTAEGISVCARLCGMRPYFYVPCPPWAQTCTDELCKALQAALQGAPAGAVRKVEAVRRTPVLVFQPEDYFLCITVTGPRWVSPCVKAFEQGISVAGHEVQSSATFEANVAVVMRFLVDFDLGGGRWLELQPGAFKKQTDPQSTTAQLELVVDLEAAGARGLSAMPVDSKEGSAVPPVRILALEAIAGADSQLNAVACFLMVHGDLVPRARAIWLQREAPPIGAEWGEVQVEEYRVDAEEPPKVFMSDEEDVLVEHLGETLAILDADILLCYELTGTLRKLLGKKAVAKAGSALARGLCRRPTAEVKLTARSNEVSGLSGRLGFDLQKQIEKDHRLTDFSLGNLCEHFCKMPLPELSEATLTKFLASRPRAYAQHALLRAEGSFRVFDRLAYLYNFVEMARVTGCPLAYLLERGQAVKVQTQLLQEARQRNFVLPSQRPGTGEETGFEGATVLDPVCGFYKSPVAVLDFASLYPSIMMANNLCYSTLLSAGQEQRPDAPEHTSAPPVANSEDAPQVHRFVTAKVRRGLLPSILERLLAARKTAKQQLSRCSAADDMQRKVLHGRQLALKLSANSVYGFTGAMNGPLPCLELAGAVTAYGREMIKGTKHMIEAHFVTSNGYSQDAAVVYGDTDSVMVRFGEDLPMEQAMRLSSEAAELCTAAFPAPVRLEFEKVYRPYLLMAKKRYAGLAWTSADGMPEMETKGIETVRRDWCDLVRQGLEQTLQLLLRHDCADGTQEAISYVRSLCDELRQNKTDFRSLVISKTLGQNEYAAKTPHSEVAEKLRKRDPNSAPRLGDRVSYLVLAGAAKAKVHEKAEDPLYALEHELPVDAEYYLEHQLKQPLIRVFEQVSGSTQKAEQALFGGGSALQKVAAAAVSSKAGMGKFMKPKPKCLACSAATVKSDQDPLCAACEGKGAELLEHVRTNCVARAQQLRAQVSELRAHCAKHCETPSTAFPELPPDAEEAASDISEQVCANLNCQVIFRRVRAAKDLQSATEALKRLKVTDW